MVNDRYNNVTSVPEPWVACAVGKPGYRARVYGLSRRHGSARAEPKSTRGQAGLTESARCGMRRLKIGDAQLREWNALIGAGARRLRLCSRQSTRHTRICLGELFQS